MIRRWPPHLHAIKSVIQDLIVKGPKRNFFAIAKTKCQHLPFVPVDYDTIRLYKSLVLWPH